jgi:hypothetical protein
MSEHWYPGLLIKAKSKETGRIFIVRDCIKKTVAGKSVTYYNLEEEGTETVFRMPADKVELIKEDGRDR